MLIICPSCATSYMLDPAVLGPAGRKVRCVRCKATWFADGTSTDKASDSALAKAPPTVPKIEIQAPPRIEIDNGPEVTVLINGVVAEGEGEAAGTRPPGRAAQASKGAQDDFGDQGTHPDEAERPSAPDDEQPIEITDAPSLVPPNEHMEEPEPASDARDVEDVESFAARRQRLQARRKEKRRSSRWTAVVLVLFALNVAFVGSRNEIVRYLPQTASLFAAIGLPVNLRHLNFEDVRIIKQEVDGAPVITVQGTIVSASRHPVDVPRLLFAARNKAGHEIYTWSMPPSQKVLQPGERLDFSSRLTSPPSDAYDVMVRFFTANDAMAGAK